MDITLYGIPTCDTCKKAMRALSDAGHTVTLRDLRAPPLSLDEWAPLITEFGDRLVNRNSTTYRGMSDWLKASEVEAQLEAHPTAMKRPVIDAGGVLYLGWGSDVQAELLNS
jgi:arsenate reductase-like glutaredoxin family protein